MRRFLPVAVALLVALVTAATAQPAVTFVLKGRGWGHGLGLSQYGAAGFAREEGRGYAWIIDHYYTGTTLGTAGVGRVRVLLADGTTRLTIGSDAEFRVKDANGKRYNLKAGAHTLRPDMKIVSANGKTRTLASPAAFKPGASPLELSGNGYRGQLDVRSVGGRLSAVNDIGLEPYIRGVVAWEMPSSWPMEALKTQAVLARTYGLVARRSGSWFDLFADTRSQVYGGIRAETTRTTQAVDATAGKVVRSNGSLAWTFYHSTSGGKTASRLDEWGPPDISYLQSVADPYDTDSPHHSWGPSDAEVDCPGTARDCVWSGRALKKKLGSLAPSGLRDMTVTRNGSSRVASVHAVGSSGAKNFSGATMRSAAGLRSTWFTVGVLRLEGSGTVEWGKRRSLPFLVRNVSGVKLQRKRFGGTWENVKDVSGEARHRPAPGVTTSFRLASPSGSTSAVRVAVRPQLRFASEQKAGSLLGTMRPVLPGTAVQVQRRRVDGSWKTVARAVLRADGTWKAVFDVRAGVYRAFAAPGPGYVPGGSPTLTVAAR